MLLSQTELIKKAIAGSVVSFPTDTVPALAVKPENGTLLYRIKQRPQTKPLILMGASLEALFPYVAGTSKERAIWQAIANKYFPGALTLVLPASNLVSKAVNPTSENTIGIRVPNHRVARDLLSHTGVLATTSANLSGSTTLVTTKEIQQAFPTIAVLEDPVPTKPQGNCLPSTVVQWQENSWQILRQGSVTFEP